MPGGLGLARVGVLDGPELQPRRMQAEAPTDTLQPGSVGGYQVCHGMPAPRVTMKPKTSLHRMHHTVTPPGELGPLDRSRFCGRHHWQLITPSVVAGGTAVTLPANSAQVSGNEAGCVALADHPDAVASTMERTTPGEVRYASRLVSVV